MITGRGVSRTVERAALIGILIGYGLLAILYATLTPPWQVPDEPAHYNYARQVAESGCCPVLEAADWDDAYRSLIVSSGFDPQHLARLDTVQYEDHQPPLFYLLAAGVYRAAGGSLIAIRLLSALIGAGVVLCVYGIARTASGGDAITALAAAAFAAFIPQHLAIMAGAGNDSLAELIVGLGALLAVWHVTPEAGRRLRPGPLALGVVTGLGVLTKASTLVLGPLLALAIVLRWRRDRGRGWPTLLRRAILFALPIAALGGLWWARNTGVYGWPDVMGLRRHDAVVIGQPRTADWIAASGFGPWLADGAATTFRSFWGQFGWMGVPMPGPVYWLLLLFTAASLAGLIPRAIRARREGGPPPGQRDAARLMAGLLALSALAFAYYNLTFVQFQGRYLYPALSAFALAAAAGWTGWAGALRSRTGWPWLDWLPLPVMLALAALSGLALWRWVIPALPAW